MNSEDGFDEAFEGFGEEPTTQVDPPTEDPIKEDNDAKDDTPTGDNSDDTTPSDDKESPAVPSDSEEDKGEETPGEPGAGDTVPEGANDEPTEPEPQPALTKADLEETVKGIINNERNSAKESESATQDVLDAYYPDGLSNTLVDESTGKELRTPQDVVDASGGEMSMDQATQWLQNEQFKLDQQIKGIREDARKIAETTTSFKRDAVAAVEKYEPLFKAYPHLQKKVFDKLMKYVEADQEKGVILKAPDVMEHYDDYLEPYQLAFEHGRQQSATQPTTPPPAPEPPKPTAEDRMDISGDGGGTPVNDPNDFAQQVTKELGKGI